MSDDESFVILGSSPMASLETDGINGTASDSSVNSLQKDTPPGSCFTSLKNSQIKDLERARETMNKTYTLKSMENSKDENAMIKSTKSTVSEGNRKSMGTSAESLLWSKPKIDPQTGSDENAMIKSTKSTVSEGNRKSMGTSAESLLWSRPKIEPQTGSDENSMIKSTKSTVSEGNTTSMGTSAESLLWSRPNIDPQTESETAATTKMKSADANNDFIPLSLEDCVADSPLTQTSSTSIILKTSNTSLKEHCKAEKQKSSMDNMINSQNSKGSSGSQQNSLAASFIMGEVNADVLKSSVYSQFPSISMQACAEDVVKLQNMVTEYMQLKTTLEKVNNTMKLFYENSLQWKDKMNHMEVYYKQKLDDCEKQIMDLRDENCRLKKSIDEQIEQTKAVDVARQTDREEMIKVISEKTALIENMRAQIVKLEQQHTTTYEFLPKMSKEDEATNFEKLYITRAEHENEVKMLKREMSVMLAANLDLKDMEQQYLDEVNCLKHNQTKADDYIKRIRAEMEQLQNLNTQQQQKINELQKANCDLLIANAKQNERLSLLELDNHNLLAENNQQNERISLLEHQNQVHKNDFEMERESRQTAMGEKQQILQDLRALQKRNQELIEEHQKLVEGYEQRASHPLAANSMYSSNTNPLIAAAAAAQTFINNPTRPIRDLPSSSSPSANNSSTTNQYNCPVCNKSFSSISVLTSHVNDCIDNVHVID